MLTFVVKDVIQSRMRDLEVAILTGNLHCLDERIEKSLIKAHFVTRKATSLGKENSWIFQPRPVVS